MRFRPLNNEAVLRELAVKSREPRKVPLLVSSAPPKLFLSSAKRIKYFCVLGLVEEHLAYSR